MPGIDNHWIRKFRTELGRLCQPNNPINRRHSAAPETRLRMQLSYSLATARKAKRKIEALHPKVIYKL
jgi:hypothetical protein